MADRRREAGHDADATLGNRDRPPEAETTEDQLREDLDKDRPRETEPVSDPAAAVRPGVDEGATGNPSMPEEIATGDHEEASPDAAERPWANRAPHGPYVIAAWVIIAVLVVLAVLSAFF